MINNHSQSDENAPIASPCVRNCCLDGNDICMGCFRSLDEILVWASCSNEQREEILACSGKRRRDCAK